MGKGAESLLIITGSMGAGKTTVMAEASDILRLHDVHHAAIDYDALGMGYLPGAAEQGVGKRNLRCVWENYAESGATWLLLARALESQAELEECRNAISTDSIVICRLTAGIDAMQERVRLREPGILQEQFVKRVKELNAILDRAHLEHFSVCNESRSVTEVAREMLARAGWLQA